MRARLLGTAVLIGIGLLISVPAIARAGNAVESDPTRGALVAEQKMGKLAALREAQIWMLRDKGTRGLALGKDAPPKDEEPLPPYYWAAFVLSGDWR
jgi:hypothetical protein